MAVVIESQKQVDLDKGIKTNVEVVDGKLQLEVVGEGTVVGNESVVPIMTSNTTPSPFEASASSYWSSDFAPWKAFDGTTEGNNRWASNGNASNSWLKVKLDKARRVVSYAISAYGTNLQNALNQMVRSWTIEGSNDDVIWVEIDRVEDQTGWDLRERREYKIANPNIFQYYRLKAHQNNGGNNASLSEWELFEEIPVLVYKHEGSYETPIIDLSIYSQEIKTISAIRNIPEGTDLRIYTSTSNDQISFSDYEEIDYATGNIISPQGRYIKIKVEFFGKTDESENMLNEFSEDERDEFQSDERLNFGDGLRLKTEYIENMEEVESWSDEGGVYTKSIEILDFNNIKSIYDSETRKVTWDEMNKGSDVVLSNNNLTSYNPFKQATISNIGKSKGKWYWEIYVDYSGDSNAVMIGVADEKVNLNQMDWSGQYCRLYYGFNGNKRPENTSYGSTYTTGDTISVILDLDDGILEFWKNGVSQGISHTNIKTMSGLIYPVVSYSASTGTKASLLTARFAREHFQYEPPMGYKPYENVTRSFIYHNGEYKKWNGNWQIVSTSLPTLEQFQNEGINSLSVLDRVPSQFEQEMTDAGVLGEGKLYKTTIDLKKYVDINGLERK